MRAGCRLPRDSLKYCSRNLAAWSRTHTLAFSLVCWWVGVHTWAVGEAPPSPAPPAEGVVRTHRLGWREERREEALDNRLLRPGVAGPDFDPEGEVVEEGAFTAEGVVLAAAPGALPSTASAAAPLVFLLLFLPLAPLFLLSMSDSLMGEWGEVSGASLEEPGTPGAASGAGAGSLAPRCLRCSGSMLAKLLPAMVQDLPGCWGPGEDQDMFRPPSPPPSPLPENV